ncbi:MAG: 5-oxoprolinase subunit PxpA [Flavisolibacter sp.]
MDLNCDLGEGSGWDEAIMPYITSANIACGFHAGNGETIRRTIDLALRYQVHVGAHPSFRDRENFGRKEMHLSPDKVYAIVLEQMIKVDLIAKEKGTRLHHVKPHGALYNMAARDPQLARTIALAVRDYGEDIILYGLSGSQLVCQAQAIGLPVFSEVFADRSYQDDGSLTPRSQAHALIEDEKQVLEQVRQLVEEKALTSLTGKKIPLVAETICLHGDNRKVLQLARTLSNFLRKRGQAPH